MATAIGNVPQILINIPSAKLETLCSPNSIFQLSTHTSKKLNLPVELSVTK